MMHTTKIYGPPGTGKTTRLMEIVAQEVAAGVPLHEFAYLSFSRAAKDVIRERMGASEQDVRWFRTIHGAAVKHLGLSGAIVSWQHYRKFYEQTGMKISPDDFEDFSDRNKEMDFNIALRAHQLALTTMRPLVEVVRTLPDHPNLQQRRLQSFIETWTKFKRDNRLFDFMDMLTMYAEEGEPLPVKRAALDEAQDLSPLQWVCWEKMSANAERVYLAGDDDQAIYTFIGGSEYGFLEHACDEEEVLSRSYRCPQAIGKTAERIIGAIAKRKTKKVTWREEPGLVARVNLDPVNMPWRKWVAQYPGQDGAPGIMVLARHRKGAQQFSDELKLAGVSHSLNGETMNTWPEAKILHTVYRLKDGKDVSRNAAIALLDALGKNAHLLRDMGPRARVNDIPGVDVNSLDWLATFSVNKRARLRYKALLKIIRTEGYEALAKDPPVVVSTMHAAKGREAELVVIVPDCTNIVKQNVDTATEIRLSYVALTRAKQTAVLMLPRTDTFIQHFFR